MGKALEILDETRTKLKIEKRVWLEQKNYDIADKINEEILDIEIAIKELECKGKKPDASKNTLPIDIVMLSFADFEKLHNWINDNDYVYYSGKTSSCWETDEGVSVCDTTKELINMFHKANEA